jgi:hypothetical protein
MTAISVVFARHQDGHDLENGTGIPIVALQAINVHLCLAHLERRTFCWRRGTLQPFQDHLDFACHGLNLRLYSDRKSRRLGLLGVWIVTGRPRTEGTCFIRRGRLPESCHAWDRHDAHARVDPYRQNFAVDELGRDHVHQRSAHVGTTVYRGLLG